MLVQQNDGRTRASRIAAVCAALAALAAPQTAHAYLDPGSISLFFQASIAGILGGLLLLKRYWAQIVDAIRRRFSSKPGDDAG